MPKNISLNEFASTLCYVVLDKHRDEIMAVLNQIDAEESLRDMVRAGVKKVF